MNCNYKVKITDIQTKYKFKVFCTGYDDSEIKEKIDTMYQAWPKATAEGETPTLDNTANATMSIDLKGNTSQDGTPTPDDPVDVQVVSGDNTIEVVGKNFFNYNVITNSSNYTNNYDGTFTRTSNGSNILINVDNASVPYNTFSLLAGTYSVSFDIKTTATVTLTNFFMCTRQNGTSANLSKSIGVQIPANTITHIKAESYVVSNNAEKVGFAGYLSTSTGVVISNIQVEAGSTATTYAPYQSQSYAVNLGTMELCKIGTYQDYIYKEGTSWYLHKGIGKVVFDENTPILSNADYISIGRFNTQGYTNIKRGSANNPNAISSHFKSKYETANGNIYVSGVENEICLINTDYSNNLAGFKTWLGTEKPIAYYILATPTTTEITDATLISQLNALAGAESYSGQTNISQTNDDKPFILTAKALKDLSNL